MLRVTESRDTSFFLRIRFFGTHISRGNPVPSRPFPFYFPKAVELFFSISVCMFFPPSPTSTLFRLAEACQFGSQRCQNPIPDSGDRYGLLSLNPFKINTRLCFLIFRIVQCVPPIFPQPALFFLYSIARGPKKRW